jgi:hypothetical protein
MSIKTALGNVDSKMLSFFTASEDGTTYFYFPMSLCLCGEDKISACTGMTVTGLSTLQKYMNCYMGNSMILAEDLSGEINSSKMAAACSFAPSPFSATGPVQAGQPSLQAQFMTN